MFPSHEGSTSIVVMRDDAAPSGSMAGSRMEGNHRNMRGRPLDWSPVGDSGKALPEPRSELRSGVGLVHTTCEVVEGNEAHGGKGPARGEPARGGQGPDTEPGRLAAEPQAGERGGQPSRPNPVHGPAAPCRRRRSCSGVPTTKAASQRGGDRVTVAKYEERLEDNLRDLCAGVHTGRYRPQPVRRVYIPKDDGGKRLSVCRR